MHLAREIRAIVSDRKSRVGNFSGDDSPANSAIARGEVVHDDIFVALRRKIGRLERSVGGIIAPLRHWNCIVARWCTKHTLHGFLAEVLAPSSHYRQSEGNSILIPARGPSRNRAGKRPPYCGQG